MDPERLRQIAANIEKMLSQGASSSEVDTYLGDEGFASADEWRSAWQSAQAGAVPQPQQTPQQQPARMRMLGERDGPLMVPNYEGGMTPGETGRMALQGVPLVGEFTDEMLGDTERVEAIREKFPLRSLLAEFVSNLVPVGAGIRAVGSPLAKLGMGALAGGATGAIEGIGAGEGSLGERATQLPAMVGATAGTVLGGAGGAMAADATRRATQRGAPLRASAALEDLSGIRAGPVAQAFPSEIRGQRADLSRIYQELADEYPVVNDPEIIAFVNDLRSRQGFQYAVDQTIGRGDTPPSFDALKNLRTRLTSMTNDEAQDAAALLTRKMDDYLEGAGAFTDNVLASNFSQLRQRYARNQGALDAFEEGRKFATRPAYDVDRAVEEVVNRMDDVGARQAREAFRAGQVSRVVEKLTRREDDAPALLRRFTQGGPGTSTWNELRRYFPEGPRGDAAMNQFVAFLQDERSAAEAAEAFERFIKRAAIAGAGGAGLLYGGNQLQGLLGGN